MRVRWLPASRLPRPPAWAAAVVALWGAGVLATHAIARARQIGGSLCLLHRFGGVPCPTCGGTRAVFAAADGDLAGAFAWNPLLFGALLAAAALLLLRAVAARRIDVSLGPGGRRTVLAGSLVLLLANWAYLLATGA